MLLAGTAWAQPALEATLEVRKGEQSLLGSVRCEGEKVTGRVEIAVAASAGSAPQLQSGGKAQGRFRVTVELAGTRAAGGELQGNARVRGTFTTEAGCEAALSGEGTFTGTCNEPAGTLEVRAAWEKVAYDKCELLSPQPFAATLPPFRCAPAASQPESRAEQKPGAGGLAGAFGGIGVLVMRGTGDAPPPPPPPIRSGERSAPPGGDEGKVARGPTAEDKTAGSDPRHGAGPGTEGTVAVGGVVTRPGGDLQSPPPVTRGDPEKPAGPEVTQPKPPPPRFAPEQWSFQPMHARGAILPSGDLQLASKGTHTATRREKIAGDFEVVVDYEMLDWQPTQKTPAGFGVRLESVPGWKGQRIVTLDRSAERAGDQVIAGLGTQGNVGKPAVPRGQRGSLRVTRKGDAWTFAMRDAHARQGDWTEVGTTTARLSPEVELWITARGFGARETKVLVRDVAVTKR